MENYYSTRDFYFAAFLVVQGVKLQSHHKTEKGTIFNFINNNHTQKMVNEYYSMHSSIEPITYANSIKSLKSVVHSYDNINTNSEVNNYVKQQKGNR